MTITIKMWKAVEITALNAIEKNLILTKPTKMRQKKKKLQKSAIIYLEEKCIHFYVHNYLFWHDIFYK